MIACAGPAYLLIGVFITGIVVGFLVIGLLRP